MLPNRQLLVDLFEQQKGIRALFRCRSAFHSGSTDVPEFDQLLCRVVVKHEREPLQEKRG